MIRTLFQDSPNHKWTAEEIQTVLQTCNDKRSWGPKIQQISEYQAIKKMPDWIVSIWTPAQIKKVYPTIGAYLSLTHHRENMPILTVFNQQNWNSIPEPAYFSGYRSLDVYKTYLINHEFGHMLGLDHAVCKAPGKMCPVMVQQTKGTQGCIPCVWPQECGDIFS